MAPIFKVLDGTMDDKTARDEQALLDELLNMLATGQDGVEAGFTTTEFWLTLVAVVIDVFGPAYGFLQGINPQEQGLIAVGAAVAYTGFRSWRKRGGPAKAIAELGKLLAQLRGQGPVTPPAPVTPAPALPAPVAPAAEAPKAA